MAANTNNPVAAKIRHVFATVTPAIANWADLGWDADMTFAPQNCPHCEYDRRFPETEMGGWLYFGNNGPYVSCPVCNDDGSFPFDAAASQHSQHQREGQS